MSPKIILIFTILISTISAQQTKLKIDVHIESQCPASKRFMQEQLKPNYEQIKNDIDLTIIPFGKSHSVTNSSGTFFECQHGSFECSCNMFQSCALNLIGDNMDVKTEFMICSMEVNAKRFHCAVKAGLKVENVKKCVESDEGIKLQLKDEKKSAPIIKQSGHVPTIVFDGKWNEKDDDDSEEDFLKVVKEKLKKIQVFQILFS